VTYQTYALEPFFGGSHKSFLCGLKQHIHRSLGILSMSPHHWKWRMHGSALYYADLISGENLKPGIILASDFVNLPVLRGLLPHPNHWYWILYFHENQLTYPVRAEEERDLTYAHMNIQSALAAHRVYFNSAFHRRNFLNAIPTFYSRFIDYKPDAVADRISAQSEVLPVGISLKRFDRTEPLPAAGGDSGIILWNQRWEHDKNPELFFRTLFQLAADEVPFRLIVCGERFEEYPRIFNEAREQLHDRILHWGYVREWEKYAQLLRSADIVVSTANHEFFGIAVLEAMYCRCYPLLPKRLVYPEYIPSDRHKKNLFTSNRDFCRKLKFALTRIDDTRKIHFRDIAAKFDWSRVAPLWEKIFAECDEELRKDDENDY